MGSEMCIRDSTVTNPRDIADKFNEFFCSIAQRLKNETGHADNSGRPPESTLNTSKRSHIVMDHVDCTVHEIEQILNSLKNKSTSDLAI